MPTSISTLSIHPQLHCSLPYLIHHHCCLWNFTPLSHLPEMLFSPTLYTDNSYWSATLNVNIISSETFPDPSVPLVHSQSLFIQFFGTVSLINNSTFTWMLLYIFFLTYYKLYECSILDCFSLFFKLLYHQGAAKNVIHVRPWGNICWVKGFPYNFSSCYIFFLAPISLCYFSQIDS